MSSISLGRDVLAATDDDVLLAVGDGQMPLGVELADIAALAPSASW
jgi:hypothetical protein